MSTLNFQLTGEISYGDLPATLIELSNQEDSEDPIDHVVVWINSPGGNLLAAVEVINLIKASKIPVTTIVNGAAESAALLILSAGHRRIALENSFGMAHHFSTGMEGTYHQFQDHLQQSNLLHSIMENIFTENTKLTKANINKLLLGRQDEFLTPERMLKYGIVDKVMKADQDLLGKVNESFKPRKKKKASNP